MLTHGFTVDENGRKLSKSLGNYIPLEEIIKQLGADGLRLYVASTTIAMKLQHRRNL
ncbi:class I tRNA ligase family protein [Acinetobacter baumannii]